MEIAVTNLQTVDHDKYIKRVEHFLKRKEEWVLHYRNTTILRGHNTNNFSESCIRVLKDIILNRTKAFNVIALVDFTCEVWEKYFFHRILHYAHNRKPSVHVAYKKLNARLPESHLKTVVRESDGTYSVPSANTEGVRYTIDPLIGWCSCYSGNSGAFCKHQALIHKHFEPLFPNAPPITTEARYELGKLAYGANCPPKSFFLDLQQSAADCDVMDTESHCQIGTSKSLDSEFSSPHDTNSTQTPMQTEITEFYDARNSTKVEFERVLHLLGDDESLHTNAFISINRKLSKIDTKQEALQFIYSLKTSVQKVKKGGKIKVQPSSVSRRRTGITRGSRRVPSGRPPNRTSIRKTQVKRQRILKQNIAANLPHAKIH